MTHDAGDESPVIAGTIGPPPPTLPQLLGNFAQRLEHLEQANKPAWFEMWRRYDSLLARVEDVERSLNKMQREAYERGDGVGVGASQTEVSDG